MADTKDDAEAPNFGLGTEALALEDVLRRIIERTILTWPKFDASLWNIEDKSMNGFKREMHDVWDHKQWEAECEAAFLSNGWVKYPTMPRGTVFFNSNGDPRGTNWPEHAKHLLPKDFAEGNPNAPHREPVDATH